MRERETERERDRERETERERERKRERDRDIKKHIGRVEPLMQRNRSEVVASLNNKVI